MVMGFVLPFALAFVAIPLESAVHSARTVLGALSVQFLRALGFLCRFISVTFRRLAKVLEMAYDITIVIPLMFERMVGASGFSLSDKSRQPKTGRA